MPSTAEQPGLVLEISRLAEQSGVKLRSLVPKEPVAGAGGPSLIPVTVTVGGGYKQITSFLARTRALVSVRNGKIYARGRLLAVQSVSLAESATESFPALDATIELDAYVYDGPIVPPEVPEPAVTAEVRIRDVLDPLLAPVRRGVHDRRGWPSPAYPTCRAGRSGDGGVPGTKLDGRQESAVDSYTIKA